MHYADFYRDSGYAAFEREERSVKGGVLHGIRAEQQGHAFTDPATPDAVIGLMLDGRTPARWKTGSTWRETDCRKRGDIGVSPMDEQVEFDVPRPHRLLIVTVARPFIETVGRENGVDMLDRLNSLHHAYRRDFTAEALLHRSWDALGTDDTMSELRVDGLGRLLLASLLAPLGSIGERLKDNKDGPLTLGRLEDYVRSRIGERITVAELAAISGLSPVTFRRRLRHQDGRTPYAFVQDIRIQVACERLLAGRDSLSRIAQELGFADQAHFSRAYKARTGISPSSYNSS